MVIDFNVETGCHHARHITPATNPRGTAPINKCGNQPISTFVDWWIELWMRSDSPWMLSCYTTNAVTLNIFANISFREFKENVIIKTHFFHWILQPQYCEISNSKKGCRTTIRMPVHLKDIFSVHVYNILHPLVLCVLTIRIIEISLEAEVIQT